MRGQILILLLASAWAKAGQSGTERYPCASFSGLDNLQGRSLQHVCEFVRSLPHLLPKYICKQITAREMPNEAGVRSPSGPSLPPVRSDVVTAELTYSERGETYQDIRLNGRRTTQAAVENSGLFWSTGDLASLLGAVFAPQSNAHFQYRSTQSLRHRETLIFDFKVARDNNLAWLVQVRGASLYPGFTGKVWIDRDTSDLARLQIQTTEMDDPEFPVKSIEHIIDYQRVALGDGTSFVLPLRAELRFCRKDVGPCFHNTTSFTGYQKFFAESRILATH